MSSPQHDHYRCITECPLTIHQTVLPLRVEFNSLFRNDLWLPSSSIFQSSSLPNGAVSNNAGASPADFPGGPVEPGPICRSMPAWTRSYTRQTGPAENLSLSTQQEAEGLTHHSAVSLKWPHILPFLGTYCWAWRKDLKPGSPQQVQ